MKITAKIRYEENYLPTPKCRKYQQRDVAEDIEVEFHEVKKEEAPIVLRVTDYLNYCGITTFDVRWYQGKLFTRLRNCDLYHSQNRDEMAQYVSVEYMAKYFNDCRYTKKTRESALKDLHQSLEKFLIVEGEVWQATGEPRYCIYTFGLGHNHASTSISVNYGYNSNISHKRYFNALQREKAIAEAVRIALARGDTNSVDGIRNAKYNIEVLDPSVIRCNPAIEHGDGDPFINQLESVTECADSAAQAGLLAIMLTNRSL